MKTFLQDHFDELKQQIIDLAGIKTIISSDCYRLSLEIEEKTQKRISETTLKRIFGFAMAQYKPSIFTLNTLAEFCDYESWNDFQIAFEIKQLGNSENMSWLAVKLNANKITCFSVETNKLKSGIPYPFTIPRQSFDATITRFISSEATACIISAPAGGGKTICLTQWVDRQINKSPLTDDIFLFINLFTLTRSIGFGHDGSHWLSYLLGMPQKGILDSFLETYAHTSPGKFYLVIDDMNNVLVNDKQFNIIFLQLIDMINHFSKFPWFKVIVSMRPITLQKYKHVIEDNNTIKRLWYTSSSNDEARENINLDNFTYHEVQKLTANINNCDYTESECVHERLSIISLPLHFQYYYQLRGGKLSPDKINQADQFEIIGMSLNRDVLKGAYHTEKKILLDKLSNLAFYKDNTICIEKDAGFPIIKEFRSAYKELLYTGILYEYRKDLGSRTIFEIRFQSVVSGSYFLAQQILRRNQNAFDIKLIETLNKTHYASDIKNAILRWLIIYSFESADLAFINHFGAIDLNDDESELILFTCNTLFRIVERSPTIGEKLKVQFKDNRFLEYALDHISCKADYKIALQGFISFNLSPKQLIMLHSALGLISLIHLEDEEMAFHVEKLRGIETDAFSVFAFNPLAHLEALYFYFKHGVVKREALEEVTRFTFHPEGGKTLTHTQINFSLAYLSSKISGNISKTLRFLRSIQKYQARNKISFSKEFIDFIQLSKAYEWLKNGQIQKATSQQLLGMADKTTNINMKILYTIYQMETAWIKKECLLQEHWKAIAICKRYNFKFFEVIARIFMIENHSKPKDQSLIEEHQAALKILFKQSGYRMESFMNWTKPNARATAIALETD